MDWHIYCFICFILNKKLWIKSMKQISIFNTALKLTLISVTALLVACGDSTTGSSSDTSVSGTIVAAPVDGANVSVVDATGNEVVKAVTTNADGRYTLVIPNGSLGQDLIIKSSGGTFVDEATGGLAGTAGDMYAYASANSLSNGSVVSATPRSTIDAELVMNHGKTMAEAEAAFLVAFGYTPDMSIDPADATTVPATDEDDAETLSGFRAAVFSQLAMDLGLSQNDQFEMFAALAQDLSDDKLDGIDASGAVAIGTTGTSLEVDIQNRFSTAMVNFNDSGYNMTGLDNAQIGNLPFGMVALTASYKIEYKQIGMMEPMEGKSTFQLHITDTNGDDVVGKTPMLMAMMHMSEMDHSTPMPTPAISDDGNGLYTVTIYYLMPSQMMDGMSMGYWDLKFTVSGEEAHFYPAVMMPMGDTAQVRLKGVGDQIMSMMTQTMVGRTYFMFKDSLTTPDMGASFDFSVFVAAQENMMSFPAVYVGSTLSTRVLAGVTVEISDDDGANWDLAADGGNGIWSVTGLSLTDGMEDQIRIRLTVNDTVNDEMKTTDGLVRDTDVNDYQTFTVTPGSM